MSKIDQLIAVFHEVKEELNKNVNNSYSAAPNAVTGTSGGQGGMYRSEGMEKQMISASPGGAQDMSMIKAHKNGQWHMDKADEGGPKDIPVGSTGFPVKAGKYPKAMKKPSRPEKTGVTGYDKAVHGPQGKAPHRSKLGPQAIHEEIDPADHPRKLAVGKADECHPDDPHHEAKEMKIADDIKSKAKKLKDMHKTEELADSIIEKLEKACGMKKEDSYVAKDGKNREANPKLRASDLGPGGKVHMIKEDAEKCEGTNEEANPSQPHNKGKFKVMPMEPKTSVKHLEATGAPYNGKDKDVKKEDMEKDAADPKNAPKDKKVKALQQQIDAGTYKPDSKKIANAMLKGEPVQGNEAKGFDENKAPGRGTLSV